MRKTNTDKPKTKEVTTSVEYSTMFKKTCPHCESILVDNEVITGYDTTAWDLYCELCEIFFYFGGGD